MPTKTTDAGNNVYLKLVRRFPLRPIRSGTELTRAIDMMNGLLDKADRNLAEQDYLDVLSDLVERYETAHEPEPSVSDADMLRHLLEAKGTTQAEAARATGI